MNWLLVFFPIAIVLEAFAPERPLFLIFGHSAPRRVDGQVHRTTCQPDGRRRWRASGSARTDQSSDVFVGVFVVAILGNAAEHATAISAALKDRMDLALSIAIGSSVQVALFVAPVLVLASFFLGPTSMDLTFPRGAHPYGAPIGADHVSGRGRRTIRLAQRSPTARRVFDLWSRVLLFAERTASMIARFSWQSGA